MINDEDRIMTEESYTEDFKNVLNERIDPFPTLSEFNDFVNSLIKTYGADALIEFKKHGDYEFQVVERAIETDFEYHQRKEQEKKKIEEKYTEKLKELEKLQDQIKTLREKIEI